MNRKKCHGDAKASLALTSISLVLSIVPIVVAMYVHIDAARMMAIAWLAVTGGCGISAVWLGFRALRRIRASPNAVRGQWLARAAITFSFLGLFVSVLVNMSVAQMRT